MTPILSAVVPVFGIIACGYVIGRMGVLGADAVRVLNGFVHAIALPALLIHGLARVPIGAELRWEFFAAYGIGIASTAFIALATVRVARARGRIGMTMQVVNATYGNTGYLGIPLALLVFGDSAIAPASLTVAAHAVLILPAASAVLEVGTAGGRGTAAVARRTISALISNPLVWGIALGLVLAATGAVIPTPIDRFLALLGDAAGPAALISIGLFMAAHPIRIMSATVIVPTVLKVVLFPLIVWVCVTYVFPLDGMWAALAVLMAAAPLGAIAFVISHRYEAAREETSATILLSTILALPILALIVSFMVDG
jgi:predicted permease